MFLLKNHLFLQKMKKIVSTFLLLTLSIHILSSQWIINRDTSLIFSENNTQFTSALSGGINSAQFSNVDLNLDGNIDIIVFDKSGNKLLPFIIDNNNNYTYSPNHRANFPKIHDWVLLEDYNCDGKNDIFTYSSAGMAVYKNTSINELSFIEVDSLVRSDYGGATPLNIYISPVDIPAISDIDNDGDLDILTFSILGGFIEYHKNLSMELYNNCDSLIFEFSESCWGLFYEGLNSYILNCQNCQCPQFVNNNLRQKHAGSTILAIDIDNDNDKDLVLGDISYNNLNLLINGGDSQNAIITSVDSLFPQNYTNTVPANIDVYPASFYVDIFNNGVKDLIVTTNTENNSENFESCWLYENIGQNSQPDFEFIKTNFLQSDMLDFGNSAYPVFFDYNNDGLDDIIIGNYGYHNPNNNPTSSLALLKNTGTNTFPSYTLVDRDWLNLSTLNLNTTLNLPALNLSPTFGDIDGDNNQDLVLGDADGKLHLFKNNGSGNFNLFSANFQSIDIGQFAHPQLIDVNRDGLTDLIIGEQDGSINYLPNNGTASNAIFDTIIENWGGIDVDEQYISSGFSKPTLYDSNGIYHLFIGSYTGEIYHYTDIDNNLNGQFQQINSSFSDIWDGGKSSVTLSDINNDNMPDIILGNLSGGISYFSSDSTLNDTTILDNIDLVNKNDISITHEKNFIIIKSHVKTFITLYNLNGRIEYNSKEIKKYHKIKTNRLKTGIYLLNVNNQTVKVLIN